MTTTPDPVPPVGPARSDSVTATAASTPPSWWPEKARLFSTAYSLTLAWDSMDPTLIAVAEWFRDRARRAFLVSFYAREAT